MGRHWDRAALTARKNLSWMIGTVVLALVTQTIVMALETLAHSLRGKGDPDRIQRLLSIAETLRSTQPGSVELVVGSQLTDKQNFFGSMFQLAIRPPLDAFISSVLIGEGTWVKWSTLYTILYTFEVQQALMRVYYEVVSGQCCSAKAVAGLIRDVMRANVQRKIAKEVEEELGGRKQ